jgi:HSP20 family protein
MDREFDEIVRRVWGPRRPVLTGRSSVTEFAVPSADVVTEGADVLINLELPGVDVERDVAVEIDRGRLVVRGKRAAGSESEHAGRVHRERWHGSFRREFRLPEGVEAQRISATYDRGILTVRLVGAAAEPKATRIEITPVVGDARPAEVVEGGSPGLPAESAESATPRSAEPATPAAAGSTA